MISHAMYDWLSRWGGVAPARVAIVEPASGRSLTYGALDDRASRLASVLRVRFRVGYGDRVALLAASRAEAFELCFACVKLGAIFVPLNWRLAPPELAAIVAHAEPKVLVADATYAEAARALSPGALAPEAVFEMDGPGGFGAGWEEALAAAQPARPWPTGLEQIANILYTSGTTGLPKGVMIPWRQVLFNAVSTALAADLGASDRCLACLPLFHTGGLHCLATPILHRGGTVLLTRGFDPDEVVRLVEAGEVTTTIAVPTMFERLVEAGLGRAGPPPRLRSLLCGGAPLPLPLLDRMHERGLPLRQGYGLTEAGPNCFTLAPLEGPHRRGSVGQPTFHSEARLVDADGGEAAPGVEGELWLRGPHLMAGYFRNPEATDAALDPDGWLHTGDTMTRTEDGYYTVVGRKKDMFISGGENVYPAEVERVLLGHPAVAEAAVVGVADETWGQVGLAVLVARPGPGPRPDDDALRAWCRERLAGYKVPKRVRWVEALPATSSGKVKKDEVLRRYGAG